MLEIITIVKVILIWIFIVIVTLSIVYVPSPEYKFFRVGYNDDLIVFGMRINSIGSYMLLLCYTALNTVIRGLQQEVLLSWITTVLRGGVIRVERRLSYISSLTNTLYIWFDFYMYMNILLTQLDIFMLETVGHMLTTYYTTRMYLGRMDMRLDSVMISDV